MRTIVKFGLALLACLAFLFPATAQEIRSLDIMVTFNPDGSAEVNQLWKVNVVRGTEWYIPIENLHGIEVDSLKVWENSIPFASDGHHWDSDRTREEKTRRCGIIDKSDGVELCWGQGELGDHEWLVSYQLRNLVQGYDDFDGFNHMFVNPEMVAGVDSLWMYFRQGEGFAKKWTPEDTKFWGFGFDGDLRWAADTSGVLVTNDEPMSMFDDVVVMMQFNKGVFQPALVNMDDTFEKHRDRALEGSDYYEPERDIWAEILAWILIIGICLVFCWPVVVVIIGLIAMIPFKKMFLPPLKKKIFGAGKIKDYWRDIPLDGDLPAAWWLYKHGTRDEIDKTTSVMGALFLRWIFKGWLEVVRDQESGKANLVIVNTEGEIQASTFETTMYRAVRAAAGKNGILEAGELKEAAQKSGNALHGISKTLENFGSSYLSRNNLLLGGVCTERGKKAAAELEGLKNFLNDFTLSKERYAEEVKLWKEYLVYAQFHGIADKVAKQFSKLIPKDLANAGIDTTQLLRMVSTATSYMAAFNPPAPPRRTYSSYSGGSSSSSYTRSSGGGGHSSHSGGGGHSGGGRGGGSR